MFRVTKKYTLIVLLIFSLKSMQSKDKKRIEKGSFIIKHKKKIGVCFLLGIGSLLLCYKFYASKEMTPREKLQQALCDKDYQKVMVLLKEDANFCFRPEEKKLADTLKAMHISLPFTTSDIADVKENIKSHKWNITTCRCEAKIHAMFLSMVGEREEQAESVDSKDMVKCKYKNMYNEDSKPTGEELFKEYKKFYNEYLNTLNDLLNRLAQGSLRGGNESFFDSDEFFLFL